VQEDVVRVLLVDDQKAFLLAMVAVVTETPGFEAIGKATSGEDALSLARDLMPDLVLMDVNLPGMDGVAATRSLRLGSSAPVVILLSTYDADAGAGFVAESGAFAYVTKAELAPGRLSELWEAVTG
jgi:DNA-binding NarL/FixJ family response regulator